MRRFILRENVKHFRYLLEIETDGDKRDLLARMLADAEYELSRHESIWRWTCPQARVPSVVGTAVEFALDSVVEKSKADSGSAQLWNESTRGLYLIAHTNFDTALAERFALVREGADTACDAGFATQAGMIVEDLEKEPKLAALLMWTRATNIRAIHTTPLFDGQGRFIGAFSAHYSAPKLLTPAQRQIYADCAEQLERLFERLG